MLNMASQMLPNDIPCNSQHVQGLDRPPWNTRNGLTGGTSMRTPPATLASAAASCSRVQVYLLFIVRQRC